MKKVIIAGGSGFLGQCLASHFVQKGYEVVILSRKAKRDGEGIRYVVWDVKSKGPWIAELEHAAALINLTGKSVDCRYTAANKQRIYDSRIHATRVLGEVIKELERPPTLWINAASATIYRHAEDRDMDEENGEIGTGFSVDVCQKWEAAFFDFTLSHTRQVALRIAIVLGKKGGALQPLINLSRIGMGGRQGNGEQYFSWIHETDFVQIVNFIIDNEALSGVFNVSSPNPVKNTTCMKSLRKAMKIPLGIPMPVWMLEIGAWIIRTETELILKSRRVVPRRLLESGYQFQFAHLQEAIDHLVQKEP